MKALEPLADLYDAYRFALLVLRGLADDLSPAGERVYRVQECEVKRLHDRLWYLQQQLDAC
jgi:hypothetical protein